MRAHAFVGARVGIVLLLAATGCGGARAPRTAKTPVSTTEITSATMPAPSPVADTMHGLFRYQADAATFEDCATGARYPVAMEGGYLDVERAMGARRSASRRARRSS